MNNTLSDFQAYLSQSFYKRIYLLEKIIGDRHWLTTGTYKEKILLSFLNDALPGKLQAKSGFIVFPCKKKFPTKARPEHYDYLNSSAYEISRQLDIIIYDRHNYSPVYEDNDLVIAGPESVRGIIEVKGSLSRKHLTDAINLSNDFTQKWRRYKNFRDNHHVNSKLTKINMYIFAWDTKVNNGRRSITGNSVRKKLAENLKKHSTVSNYEKIPIIDQLFVYNDYEVKFLHYDNDSAGYMTLRGRYIIFNEDGTPGLSGDKTIFSLLRNILSSNELLYNRFLVDSDETNYLKVLPHADSGYSTVHDLKD
jgi:hypothetical protein